MNEDLKTAENKAYGADSIQVLEGLEALKVFTTLFTK